MLTRTTMFIAASTALVTTAASPAGPLNADRLPADATWVMHVDFEQMRKSTIGRLMLDDDMGLDIDEMRDGMEDEVGFDPFEEAMDLTIHGGKSDKEAPVVIMTATPVLDSIVQHIEVEAHDYERLIVDGYTLHTWVEPEKNDEQMYLQISPIHNDKQRRAVVSNSLSRLLLTLKTMENESPNITEVKSAQLNIAPRLGSLLYVQCASLHAIPDMDLDKHIKDAAGRVTFEISEHQQRSRIELAATADSEDRAETVSEIMQGLIAVGKLITGAEDDMQPLNRMLRATKSKALDSEVSVRFEVPSDELRELLHGHDGHGDDREIHDKHDHDHGHDHHHEHG